MNDNQNKILVWKQPVLYQKNIVVTGGTSGIGFAIANTCLYAGCEKIVITGRNEKKLKEAIDKLRKEHPEKAECVLGSLLDLESIKDFQEKFNEIISIFGQTKVNIWINRMKSAGRHWSFGGFFLSWGCRDPHPVPVLSRLQLL